MTTAQAKTEIQNLHGRFAQLYTARQYEKAAELFSRRKAGYECPEDGVNCTDYEQVKDYFKGIGESEKNKPYYYGMFPLMNNPCILIENETHAKGCWTSHCYIISDGENGLEIEYGIRRYDAELVYEGGAWKYEHLKSFYYISFVPMPYDPEFENALAVKDRNEVVIPEVSKKTSAADFLEIQQLQSILFQNKFRDGLSLFSENEDIELSLPTVLERTAVGRKETADALAKLLEMENENEGRCVIIPMIESPIIEVQEDDRASASWHVVSHEIKGSAFGHGESYCPMYTRVGRLVGEYVKENGCWKILKLKHELLFTLPPFRYDREASRMLCMESRDSKWMEPPKATGFSIKGHEEDMFEIQEIVAFWSGSIRHRSFGTLVYEKAAWERPDLTDGKLLCRQIFGMTDSFYKDQPKYAGFHCGTTPYVQIDDDLGTAEVTWFDYGYTSFGEKFGYFAFPWYANPGIARYHMKVVKCDETWKIYSFDWKPFFRIEYQKDFWKFDYARAKGWCGSASEKRFPLPFGEYEYTEEHFVPGKPGFELEPPEISCPLEVQVGVKVGYDVLKKYSGYYSDKPIPRAVPADKK